MMTSSIQRFSKRAFKSCNTDTRKARSKPVLLAGITLDISADTLMRGQLRALSYMGFDVHLGAADTGLLQQVSYFEKVSTHNVPMERGPHLLQDLRALLQWLLLIHRIRPDIISVGTPKASLLALVASAILRIPRRVYVVRGLRLEGATGVTRKLLLAIEKLCCYAATDTLAVSPSLGAELINLKLVNQCWLIGSGSSNGVDYQRIQNAVMEERLHPRWHKSSSNNLLITYLGRLHPDKGIDDLRESLQIVTRTFPDIEVALVGPNDGYDVSLSEWACRQLHVTGPLRDPEIVLAHTDILVLPTKREGFPNVILEAAAAGVPAVTTTATGARDAVLHGSTGLQYGYGNSGDLADALLKLLQSDETRISMGENAATRAKSEFSQATYWEALASLYLGRQHSSLKMLTVASLREHAASTKRAQASLRRSKTREEASQPVRSTLRSHSSSKCRDAQPMATGNEFGVG